MRCGDCPLILTRANRCYCERHECAVGPDDECIDDEEPTLASTGCQRAGFADQPGSHIPKPPGRFVYRFIL
jgi:hypothetical protein